VRVLKVNPLHLLSTSQVDQLGAIAECLELLDKWVVTSQAVW
jgi:hypothetical protein